MTTTPEDLETFLRRLDRAFEKVDASTYLVSLGQNLPAAVLKLAPPVLVVQVDVAEAPSENPSLEARLFRRLLELNATDLVYAAFGIEGSRIIIDAAMDLDAMRLHDLERLLSNLDLSLAEHVPHLRDLVKKG